MKFSTLNSIVINAAEMLRTNAGYAGAWDDGGAAGLLGCLDDFKTALIHKYNLRPSEYSQLESKEVGEPSEFNREILDYKISLAKNIKL